MYEYDPYSSKIDIKAGRDSYGFERLTSTSSMNMASFCSPAAIFMHVILLFSNPLCQWFKKKLQIELDLGDCLVDFTSKS